MKYPVLFYAKALAMAVAEAGKSDAVAKNFLALVRRNGDGRYLPKIVRESERLMRKQHGVREITVASARGLKQPPRALLKNFAKPEDEVYGVIMPELVAGVKIMVDGEAQFDGSLKGKIDRMFKNI